MTSCFHIWHVMYKQREDCKQPIGGIMAWQSNGASWWRAWVQGSGWLAPGDEVAIFDCLVEIVEQKINDVIYYRFLSVFTYQFDASKCLVYFWQISSPACTELEMVVMDWLAKLLNLPEDFLSTGKGGGVIQVWRSLFRQGIITPA